jgi:signal transduction histidine kinase/phage shock protein PspC (stress-responsive transcriptional regulator)
VITTSPTPTTRQAFLTRDPDDRILAGVAAAAGRRLGVDAAFVRVALAVLSLAGGAGILVYLVTWAVTPEVAGGDDRPAPAVSLRRAAALGLQVLGAMLLLRAVGLWLGDALVWPLTLTAVGSSVLWARSDDAERARWAAIASADRPVQAIFSDVASVPRQILGGALAISGMLALFAANVDIGDIGGALVAVTIATAGLALILGPAIWRLVQQAGQERRERIRSEERSEIAAHLHDSVLHTLALIQRSDSPLQMATLARSQERELRSWLQGRTADGAADTLASALEAVAARLEATHHVAVDLVVVGDALLDDQLRAVTAAAGEAAANAARHSGAQEVSIYVEVEPETITAYVRDEGLGFEPATVPDDRRGIAHSIRGRIERHGGTVKIDSQPGEGTEVAMSLPRRPL